MEAVVLVFSSQQVVFFSWAKSMNIRRQNLELLFPIPIVFLRLRNGTLLSISIHTLPRLFFWWHMMTDLSMKCLHWLMKRPCHILQSVSFSTIQSLAWTPEMLWQEWANISQAQPVSMQSQTREMEKYHLVHSNPVRQRLRTCPTTTHSRLAMKLKPLLASSPAPTGSTGYFHRQERI